LIEVKPFS